MDKDLRKEIEAADFALKTARAELARLQEETARLPQEREATTNLLQARVAAIVQALELLTTKQADLEAEKLVLRHEIDEGRRTITSRPRPYSPHDEDPTTSLQDVVHPAGWRKGQAWYSRLAWWVLGAKEWK